MKKVSRVLLLVGGTALLLLSGAWAMKPKKPKERYAVIVLGSHSKQHALKRVEAAKWVASKYGVSKMIFTGGAPHGTLDGKTEADFMADAYGPASFPIHRETQSTSTGSNLSYSLKYLDPMESVIVVSNHDHVISAAWCLEYNMGHPAMYVYYPGGTTFSTGHITSGSIQNQKAVEIDPEPVLCGRAGCCI